MVGTNWRHQVRANGWAILIGLIVGATVAPLALLPDDMAEGVYDWANPVLRTEATVISKTAQSWRIVMVSEKLRDCRLLEVQAFDVGPDRAVHRLRFQREDGAPPQGMPKGNFRSATYIILPPPANRLQLSFLHECNGRTVRTPVELKG